MLTFATSLIDVQIRFYLFYVEISFATVSTTPSIYGILSCVRFMYILISQFILAHEHTILTQRLIHPTYSKPRLIWGDHDGKMGKIP